MGSRGRSLAELGAKMDGMTLSAAIAVSIEERADTYKVSAGKTTGL